MKQRFNNRGYMLVSSSVNGKIFTLLVHRIVATCFIPNPNNLPETKEKFGDDIAKKVEKLMNENCN